MAQYSTEGIVIGGSKIGEADRILRILTKEHGKVSAMARGVRRGKSKFSGCLEPMMVNNFLLAEGKNMEVVCQVENLRSYVNIRGGYALITRAGYLLDVTGKLTEEGLPDATTYDLLLGALDALENGAPPDIVELMFKCGLLRNHGVFPDLSGCSNCGRKRTKAIHYHRGGMSFICDDCAKAMGVYRPVSRDTLKGLFKASIVQTPASLTGNEETKEINDAEEVLILVDEMLSAFLQAGVGRAKGRKMR